MDRKLTKAEAEAFKYVRTFGDLPKAEENTFIEVTRAGLKEKPLKLLLRADRIEEISCYPNGSVMIRTRLDSDQNADIFYCHSVFSVLECYETVIELCIRAGLQIIRKD